MISSKDKNLISLKLEPKPSARAAELSLKWMIQIQNTQNVRNCSTSIQVIHKDLNLDRVVFQSSMNAASMQAVVLLQTRGITSVDPETSHIL